MKEVRYRTEAFGGSQVRDAAEVMAFETFQLGNADILEHLRYNIIDDPDLLNKCTAFIEELDRNGYVDDMTVDEQVAFFRNILSEIEKQTGISVKYALWLADKEVVTNRKWYGRDMEDDDDFDSYEIGSVILSDLGGDGTLYGYPEMPIPLEEKIERLQDQLIDVINQRENEHLSFQKAQQLNERYLELDAEIQAIECILTQKLTNKSISPSMDMKPSLAERLANATVLSETQTQTAYPQAEKAVEARNAPER